MLAGTRQEHRPEAGKETRAAPRLCPYQRRQVGMLAPYCPNMTPFQETLNTGVKTCEIVSFQIPAINENKYTTQTPPHPRRPGLPQKTTQEGAFVGGEAEAQG